MASWVQNMGLSKGSHLVEGSTFMPKWEDRSGIAIAENNINLLPKNVAQDPMLAKGALFEIHGDQETFNLHQMLYEKTFESEYFKALFIFKTFEKVVDVIYEKVTYVEPWAATEVRSPSSAYCLLLKLFHLRLTEPQVRALLDHGDSTYIRALGALYVRYACPPEQLWRWLGDYADDFEEFAPGLDKTRTTTFGEYCLGLFTDLQYYTTMLPRIPVPVMRTIKVELVLFEEMVRRGKKNSRYLDFLQPGAVVRAIFRDEGKDPAWHEATVVSRIEPYDGAPEGTLPTFRVQFSEACGSVVEVVKTGQIDLPASVTTALVIGTARGASALVATATAIEEGGAATTTTSRATGAATTPIEGGAVIGTARGATGAGAATTATATATGAGATGQEKGAGATGRATEAAATGAGAAIEVGGTSRAATPRRRRRASRCWRAATSWAT